MSPHSIPVRAGIPSAVALVADPPWSFGDSKPGGRPGAETHYQVLNTKEIAEFPLPELREDAILFLWRVSSQVEEAYRVLRAWGFEPKSEIVWVKCTRGSEGNVVIDEPSAGAPFDSVGLSMGMGHYVRGAHETCIVATRGKMKERIRDRSVRTVFFAPVNEHSRKPQKFYEIVEKLVWGESPALDALGEREAYRREACIVELFARRERAGWECFGNELKVAHPIARMLDGWDKAQARAAVDIDDGKALDALVADAKELWLPPGEAASSANATVVAFTNVTEAGAVERVATVRRAIAEGLLPIDSPFNDDTWTKLAYAAPPGWFGVKPAKENLSALADLLEKKGLRKVSLLDIAQWAPVDRQAAIAWVRGHIRTLPPIIAALGDDSQTKVGDPCAACDNGVPQTDENAFKHTHTIAKDVAPGPAPEAGTAAAHRAAKEAREAGKGKRSRKKKGEDGAVTTAGTTDAVRAPGEAASAAEAAPLPTKRKRGKHTEHRPDGNGGAYVGAQNDPKASAWDRAEAVADREMSA